MKFLHLGDLHLGRSLGDFDLAEDQACMLRQLLGIVDDRQVDAVLIAGDVYDRAVPREAATAMLDGFLSSLAERGVCTYIISGNHDSDERLHYGSGLFEANRIFIAAKYEGRLCRRTLKTGKEEADIYLLPFVKASRVRHYWPEEKIETYEDAVRVILAHADLDPERFNVLLAHQFVTGRSGDPALGGSESLGTKSVGLVEKISCDCFDAFDYVALGHIHSPQKAGREEVRYAGSPLKYSLSEADSKKSVPLVTVRGKEKPEIELIPLTPLRDVRHIRGRCSDLLSQTGEGTEDYIYATLTDEDMLLDAMGVFRIVYPRMVRLDYDNSHTRAIEQADISKIAENRSFEDLMRDFYRQIYSCEISGEEMEIMTEVAREAGVLHEAD